MQRIARVETDEMKCAAYSGRHDPPRRCTPTKGMLLSVVAARESHEWKNQAKAGEQSPAKDQKASQELISFRAAADYR